jgi:hypothetical protein
LKSIFHANYIPFINGTILTAQPTFGGICDENDNVIDYFVSCYTEDDNVVIAPSGTVRAGAVTKTCEIMMVDNDNIDTPLAKNSLTKADPIDLTNLTLQYQLFYPFKQPPPNLIDSLLTYESLLGNRTEASRNIHLALCISPEWQIP